MSAQRYRLFVTDVVEIVNEEALMQSAELFLELIMEKRSPRALREAKSELRAGGAAYAFQILAQVCAMQGVRTVESQSYCEPL